MTYEQAAKLLEENGQSHLLRFWDQLDAFTRKSLLEQIGTLDFTSIGRMQAMLKEKGAAVAGEVKPARVVELDEATRALLAKVRGLELLEMAEAESCCGFGGTFAVKFPTISTAMDEVKTKRFT